MRTLLVLLLIASGLTLKAQVKAGDITGKWITEEGKSVVEIYEQGGKYFGKIIWLKDPLDENGQPKKDTKNPDSSKRGNEIKGMLFLKNFSFDGERWTNGEVYDPESGNTYSGHMNLRTHEILDLRGYIGISMLGRTATWVRKK